MLCAATHRSPLRSVADFEQSMIVAKANHGCHREFQQRAKLARELLESLDALPAEALDQMWLDEAGRRAMQIDSGDVQLISAEEVDRKARALLR